jgi:hypothetical protein
MGEMRKPPTNRYSYLRATDARLPLILNGKQAADFGEIVDTVKNFLMQFE